MENEILTIDPPVSNGADHALPPIPVLGTEPVAPKPKRKRRTKAQMAAARAKVERKAKKPDPIRDEASKASAAIAPELMVARPVEETPVSPIVRGTGGFDRLPEMFRADAPARIAPPIKSTWAQRFVFGLKSMTGFGPSDGEPVRLSTTLTVILCFAIVGAAAGVARAFW